MASAKGSAKKRPNLTLSSLRQLRAQFGTSAVARMFGVTEPTIRRWASTKLPEWVKTWKKRPARYGKPVKAPRKTVVEKPAKAKKPSKKPAKKPAKKPTKGPPPPLSIPSTGIVPTTVQTGATGQIVLTKEIMIDRLNNAYRKIEKNITPSIAALQWNQGKYIKVHGREGFLLNRRFKTIVTQNTLPKILRRVGEDAVTAVERAGFARYEIFVTFCLFEYGTDFIGSPGGEPWFTDNQGDLVQTFLSTRVRKQGTNNLKMLGHQVKRIMLNLIRSGKSAAKIDHFLITVMENV